MTASAVQKLYVAYFNRPADTLGLNYWVSVVNAAGGSTAAVSASFASSAEYAATYAGMSTAARVDAIYTNLFGRSAEPTGLTYWGNLIDRGLISVSNAVTQIAAGAQGSDLVAYNNKVTAATAFTAALGTTAEIVAYSGTTANAAAKVWMSGITTDATLTAATTTAALNASVAGVVVAGAGSSSAPVSLVAGADNISGTSGNDVFNAVVGTAGFTLSALDTVNGGSGVDTLNITAVTGATNVLGNALVSGVEVVNIRATDNMALTLDAAGLTSVGLSGTNTTTTAITNLANNATVSYGSGAAITAVTGTYVAAATTANLAYAGGTQVGATLVGAGLTSANITSAVAASASGIIASAETTLKTFNIAANSNLTTVINTAGTSGTLNVSGAAALVNLGTLDTDFTTVNASGLTAGGLNLIMSTTATTTITGGAGNDIITTGGVLTTGSVNAGAGTADRLVVTTTADLATAALGAKYTGFEVLGLAAGQAANLDNIAGITALITAGAATFTNVSATQAANITVSASGVQNIGVKNAANVGQIDTVALTIDDGVAGMAVGPIALTIPVLTGIEKLSINAADNYTITELTAATSLDAITLTGAATQGIIFAVTPIATNFAVNGSAATGVLTINAAGATGNAVAITGGSANDVLTGTALADIINGGAGNDVIVGGAGNDTINGDAGTDTITGGGGVDTMTGGAGADTFAFAVADVFGADGAAVADVITDFTVGTDKLQFTAFVDVVSPQQAAVQAAVTALAAAATDAQIATAMANANTTDLAVSFAVFGGNTYAYAETTGATATHVANANIFVKLTGVATAPTFAVDVVA